MTTPLMQVSGLGMTYAARGRGAGIKAVDGLDFEVRAGETLGLVGESGCGKSTTGRMLVRLLDPTAGQVRFQGQDIGGLSQRELRPLRAKLQIIFQDPFASLNPRRTVRQIVSAPLRAQGVPRAQQLKEVEELIQLVGLAPEHLERYPHQFSGGQAQRIGIARALATRPALVVADEPVSALDVSIQAGVLNLLQELKATLDLSYLFVSHDLSVIRHLADRVSVMYLGRTVEQGPVAEVFGDPRHPYTRALLSAVPLPDPAAERARTRILLAGDPPSPTTRPTGCAFRTRCPLYATLGAEQRGRCEQQAPALDPAAEHDAACHWTDA
jgi:peptide/nickel transport system ATP-binding protein